MQAVLTDIAGLAPTLKTQRAHATMLFNEGRRALLWHGNALVALAPLEAALENFRALGDDWYATHVLIDLGMIALVEGDVQRARSRHEEALVLARVLGDKGLLEASLNNLGEAARCEGAYERAEALYHESLEVNRGLGNGQDVPRLLHNLGYVALHRGDIEQAEDQFRQSMQLFRDIKVERGIAEALTGLGAVFAVRSGSPDDAIQAARLWGAAKMWHRRSGTAPWPADQMELDDRMSNLRTRLGTEAFAEAFEEGQSLQEDEATTAGLQARQGLLEALERNNLFVVPLDDRREWYRYHHLFADAMRHRLSQRHTVLVPRLHERASHWFEQHGFPDEAVAHALHAGSFERAATLIERAAPALHALGARLIMESWLAA